MQPIHAAQPLFAWGQLEDCPTLATIRDFLDAIPDQSLLDGLRRARGHGRDDYPVERPWRVVLLTIGLRHHSFNDCLAELHRNPPRTWQSRTERRQGEPAPCTSKWLIHLGALSPRHLARSSTASSTGGVVALLAGV